MNPLFTEGCQLALEISNDQSHPVERWGMMNMVREENRVSCRTEYYPTGKGYEARRYLGWGSHFRKFQSA